MVHCDSKLGDLRASEQIQVTAQQQLNGGFGGGDSGSRVLHLADLAAIRVKGNRGPRRGRWPPAPPSGVLGRGSRRDSLVEGEATRSRYCVSIERLFDAARVRSTWA